MAIKKQIGYFLLIVIGVVCAVGLLIATANSTIVQTDALQQYNETVTISSARIAGAQINQAVNFTLVNGQGRTGNTPISGFLLTNVSGYVISAVGNYTLDTNSGNFSLLNGSYFTALYNVSQPSGNLTLVNYIYFDTNYVDDASSRLMIRTILIFSALGILFFVVTQTIKSENMQRVLNLGGGARVENSG